MVVAPSKRSKKSYLIIMVVNHGYLMTLSQCAKIRKIFEKKKFSLFLYFER